MPERIVQGSINACPSCNSRKKHGKLLSTEEVVKLNRGVTVSFTSVSAGDCITERSPSWWFHGDVDWLPYDKDSSQKLESAFQAFSLDSATNQVVLLSVGGKVYRRDAWE